MVIGATLKNGEMSELAEGARLEIVCAVTSGTEGSNPSLSATPFAVLPFLYFPFGITYNFQFQVLYGAYLRLKPDQR